MTYEIMCSFIFKIRGYVGVVYSDMYRYIISFLFNCEKEASIVYETFCGY